MRNTTRLLRDGAINSHGQECNWSRDTLASELKVAETGFFEALDMLCNITTCIPSHIH